MFRLGLECDLRREKEQRQGLQRDLQREQDNSTELRTQLQQLTGLQKVSATPTTSHMKDHAWEGEVERLKQLSFGVSSRHSVG